MSDTGARQGGKPPPLGLLTTPGPVRFRDLGFRAVNCNAPYATCEGACCWTLATEPGAVDVDPDGSATEDAEVA